MANPLPESEVVSEPELLPEPESGSKEIAEQTNRGAIYIVVALAGLLIVGVTTTTLLKKYKK